MRNNISSKLNNKGMTMVEVLMGFAILSIILGGVVTVIRLSSQMYFKSADMRKEQTTLSKMAYSDSMDGKTDVTGDLKMLHVTDGVSAGEITLEDGTSVSMKNTKVYQAAAGDGDNALKAYIYVSTVTPTPHVTPMVTP